MVEPNLESLIKDLYNHALLLNPKHPAPELLNLARFVKREEAKYRGTATSALMYEELFKML
ncbi:Uncharacterised protein [Streptococcus pneumoniae]|nr:Uncharacterised protein [Streptococcus pneumoniae]